MHPLRQAIRQVFRAPGLTSVVVLSLALGIGANTIVFSWIDTILLRPLSGVPESQNIVALLPSYEGAATGGHTISLPDIQDYNDMPDILVGVIGSQITPAALQTHDQLQWLYGQVVTGNFFEVLQVSPQPGLGRTFQSAEITKPGGDPLLVISDKCWRTRFEADPGIVGRVVEINRHAFTIIGVMPPEFHGTMSGILPDFWAPVSMHREIMNSGSLDSRSDRWLHTQARLLPGVSPEQAEAAFEVRARQIAEAHPENRKWGVVTVPMWKTPYGGQAIFLPLLRVLAVVGITILLLVTANVANLLVAKATARQHETAIRLAIGAGRSHLIRQWLTESAVYASIGGALGLLFSLWGASLFSVFIPSTYLPIGYGFGLNGRVVGITVGLTALTGLLFGLAPALFASRADVQSALKNGGRAGSQGGSANRLRNLLVIGEIALALMLLVGAGLCIRGSQAAREIDPGFDPDGRLIAGMRIGMNGYDEARGLSFYRQLFQRLQSTPGVESAALSSWFPLGFEGGPGIGIEVPGYTPAPNETMGVSYAIISPHYFDTLDIKLLAGRDFNDLDDMDHPPAMIINRAMAERYWPGREALGQIVRTWRGEATVVGIVETGRYRALNEAPQSFAYLPYGQGVWDLNLGVVLNPAGGDARNLIPILRQAVEATDSNVALWATQPMNDFVDAAYLVNDISTTLLSALGVVALLLAAMGIYGVMAFMVGRRLPEFGIRIALGAGPRQVAELVFKDGLRLVLAGLILGGLGAWAAGTGLAAALPGVSSHDLLAFISVATILVLVALLACWLPARRAMHVDPIEALHAE